MRERWKNANVLDTGRTLRILGPIADALDVAHGEGLLHSALKPKSIVVGRNDHAVLTDFGRDSVCAVDDALAVGHFVFAVDKNRAFAAQFVHHKAVVDDLLAHIDGRAKRLKGDADNIDGPYHAGAESPRF